MKKIKAGEIYIGERAAYKICGINADGYFDVITYMFNEQKNTRYSNLSLVRSTFKMCRLATKTETAKYTLLAGW